MKRQQAILLAIMLVILGVIVLLVVLLRQSPQAASPEELQAQVLTQSATDAAVPDTILYTVDGFTPRTITITKGATITFINTTSQLVQPVQNVASDCSWGVAADCSPINPGAQRTFTITKTGDITYFDQLRPSVSGTIHVQ